MPEQHLVLRNGQGENRAEVMSELHAQIQDAFNEFGAQIMSPHFESQPDKKVVVPKTQWHAEPAVPPPGEKDNRSSATGSDSSLGGEP